MPRLSIQYKGIRKVLNIEDTASVLELKESILASFNVGFSVHLKLLIGFPPVELSAADEDSVSMHFREGDAIRAEDMGVSGIKASKRKIFPSSSSSPSVKKKQRISKPRATASSTDVRCLSGL